MKFKSTLLLCVLLVLVVSQVIAAEDATRGPVWTIGSLMSEKWLWATDRSGQFAIEELDKNQADALRFWFDAKTDKDLKGRFFVGDLRARIDSITKWWKTPDLLVATCEILTRKILAHDGDVGKDAEAYAKRAGFKVKDLVLFESDFPDGKLDKEAFTYVSNRVFHLSRGMITVERADPKEFLSLPKDRPFDTLVLKEVVRVMETVSIGGTAAPHRMVQTRDWYFILAPGPDPIQFEPEREEMK